ncbi:MAG TPA: class I SAM-dependent methyltransferase [Gemmatimonadaceae bacterium]|nr:class I SAM-dependent methyltransferase [Gemmatimonadaceae bacterium]
MHHGDVLLFRFNVQMIDLARVNEAVDQGWAHVRNTPGYLSEREARFIMTALALAPAEGANVEIGSFKGRSTVGLGTVARILGLDPVHAIDPHTSPSTTDPNLNGATTSYDDFITHVESTGSSTHVVPHRAFSHDVAKTWTKPIRFLWIDGDHTYAGAHADVEMFKPFLADGAIVAMHDVLGTFEGSLRVFVEDVLDSDDFGPAGFSGSIGWAQFRPKDGHTLRYRVQRRLLAIPARRLIPVAQSGRNLAGWNKYVYKFWRPLAPHGDVDAGRLARQLVIQPVAHTSSL